ncbi:hypothetical protein MKC73_09895 [[Clostridium] innocuum]|nr:hypothetical protein [[Clostridium] innocuum]
MLFELNKTLLGKTVIDDEGIHIKKEKINFDNVIGVKYDVLNTGSAKITIAVIGGEKKEIIIPSKKIDIARSAFEWLLKKTNLEDEDTAYAIFQYEIDHPYRDEKLLKKINNNTIMFEDQQNIAKCPKCGSPSIYADRKRLSVGRAAIGAVVAGPLGSAVGAVTSKKNICICMKCGHKWKI